ncbi:hypothetical protein [Stigmatella aurantiaca]|uniref:hypothetical protein n=1 Tax=Stigmatella aurantiaca TaxID=41 RepID=UPI0005A13F00|nr:hypothetical protein [Stigmatella aurantiaca]
MQKNLGLVTLLGVFIGTAALAGERLSSDVVIQVSTGMSTTTTARGVLFDARNSPDNFQKIGCFVETYDTGARGTCEARDISGRTASCYSLSQHLIDAMRTVDLNSYIVFISDYRNVCLGVTIYKHSLYGPAQAQGVNQPESTANTNRLE